MATMRYPRATPIEEASRDLSRLEELLGMAWLDRRLKEYEVRRQGWGKRPYTVWSQPEPHPLVPGLWELRELRRKGRSLRRGNLPREVLLVAEHAHYISMVVANSPRRMQRRVVEYLGRRLHDGAVGPILMQIFQAAIERWEFEQMRAAGEPTGRTVRPHVRRAHAHLYWTGKGREVPRVRFLLPIEVRGGVVGEVAEGPRTIEIR